MANVNTASIDLNPIVPYQTSIFESGFIHVVFSNAKTQVLLAIYAKSALHDNNLYRGVRIQAPIGLTLQIYTTL